MFFIKLPRVVIALLLSSLCLAVLGCGGTPANPSPQPFVGTISISPGKVALQAGNSVQFRATNARGTSGEDLEWFANGVIGGNSRSGTISKAGLYTAPKRMSSSSLNVAISVKNKTNTIWSSGAAVTVLPTAASVTVAVLPTIASLYPNQVQKFTATVTGAPNSAISWFVNGDVGGNSTVGTVSSTGVYTAPKNALAPPSVAISATSMYDPASSASARVTILAASGGAPNPPAAPVGTGEPVATPVINVLAYGATVNTGIDSTAAINNAVASCPKQGCTVHLPTGTYALKNSAKPIVINQPHVSVVCDPGAILQAQSGFLQPNWPELEIQGSASDVKVQGCVFDGNGISGRGAQVDSTAANIYFDHIEVKNQTQYAALGAFRTGGLWQISNSYFHNTPALYDLAGNGGAPSFRVENNRFDSIAGIMVGASGINSFEAARNQFSNSIVGRAEG